jgi:hypothetical protein
MAFPWLAKSKPAYSQFESSFLHPEQQQLISYERSSRIRFIISHALTFLIAVFLSISLLTIYQPSSLRPPNPTPQTKLLHCGNTTAEARSLGCIYDPLANYWVPSPCYDKEGAEEFMTLAPWRAYDTQEAKHVLSLDEMSERVAQDPPRPYWTSLREHSVHCALMWQRLHRGFAIEGNKKILDVHVASFEHTVHCSNSLLRLGDGIPEDMEKITVRTEAGFSKCEIEI